MYTRIKQLLAPPIFEHEEKTHVAGLLNFILWTLIIVAGVYLIVALIIDPNPAPGLIGNGITVLVYFVTMLLMRRGYVMLANILFSLTFWVLVTLVAIAFAGIYTPALFSYFTSILVAGLLLGGRGAFGFAILSIGGSLGLLYAEINQALPPSVLLTTPVLMWWVAAVNFIMAAVLLHLSIRSTNQALAHARHNEQALARANEALQGEIAERQQAEAELRTSEERYRILYEDNPSMYFTVSQDGTVLSVNKFGADCLGYSVTKLVGRSLLTLIHEDDREAIHRQLMGCLQNFGQVIHWEVRKECQDGRILWVKEAMRAVRDTNGDTVALIVCDDITEQKQAEEAMRLAQKMESLGVLASGVAHDFNNLLVAMLGQTSLALAKLSPASPSRTHIEKAVKAAERAGDLTRQLLAYSGRGHFEVRPIHLNRLIQENLHLFAVIIPKHIQLITKLAESLPFIEGDPGQMQQVIMNLILNAADAIGREPGTITVTTNIRNIEATDKRLWLYIGIPPATGHYVTLAVGDDGCGMDSDTLSKIFDPFFTTKHVGHGLGLAAVLGIMRGHKGGVQVSSEMNAGTRFKLFFPAGSSQPLELAVPQADDRVSPLSGLILVIDDEAPVREAITDIFAQAGIEVITAADGAAGIALYRERAADIQLVLLDLSMPGLSSEETFWGLYQINAGVQVILSSGYDREKAFHQFAHKGVVGFIQKPYSAADLVEKVRQFMP